MRPRPKASLYSNPAKLLVLFLCQTGSFATFRGHAFDINSPQRSGPAVHLRRYWRKNMSIIARTFNSKIFKIAGKCLVVAGIALLTTHPGFARDRYETIEAQAWGTGTQMGASIGVTLNIYEFSTPADRV